MDEIVLSDTESNSSDKDQIEVGNYIIALSQSSASAIDLTTSPRPHNTEARARELKRQGAKQRRQELQDKMKAAKRNDRVELQASLGKFADQEIAVTFERRLGSSLEGRTFSDYLKNAAHSGKNTQYHVASPFDFHVRGAIKWLWRPHRYGGASGSMAYHQQKRIKLEAIPFVAMYCSGVDFVTMVLENETQQLHDQIRALRANVHQTKARVCFIVEGLHKAIVRIAKGKKGCGAARQNVQSEIYNRVARFYLESSCLTKFTVDLKDSAEYLVAITRELSMVPYREKETAIDFVPRLKSFRARPDGKQTIPSDAWLHFLQTIPGVSESKAQKILDHYPTIDSLMSVYMNPSIDHTAKEIILMDKMGERSGLALSRRIYIALSGRDPSRIIL